MKISGGLSEDGIVVGNTYDKYNAGNPLVRKIMKGFETSLKKLVDNASPSSIHEVGCGEGYWVLRWSEEGMVVRGSDFSRSVIELAKKNAIERRLPTDIFQQRSIYELQAERDAADLVVCCEVLEHLEQPEEALRVLQKVTQKFTIFSVPREPVWSVMNMARGKYWPDYGNTPGHVQRWSRRAFVRLIEQYFVVEQECTPLPWTMLLCSPRQKPD